MKIEIYNFGQLKIRKVIGYTYLVLAGIGAGLMLEGVGHHTSFFERHNAPTWLYIFSILGCIILLILFLNSISSDLRKTGDIEFDKHQITIKRGKKSIIIPNNKINKIKVSPDYRFSHEKGDKRKRILQISTDELDSSYGIEVTQPEEDELIDAIQQIINSPSCPCL